MEDEVKNKSIFIQNEDNRIRAEALVKQSETMSKTYINTLKLMVGLVCVSLAVTSLAVIMIIIAILA